MNRIIFVLIISLTACQSNDKLKEVNSQTIDLKQVSIYQGVNLLPRNCHELDKLSELDLIYSGGMIVNEIKNTNWKERDFFIRYNEYFANVRVLKINVSKEFNYVFNIEEEEGDLRCIVKELSYPGDSLVVIGTKCED